MPGNRSFSMAVLALAVIASGQGANAQSESGWKPPKTSFGHPDIQASWTTTSATGLERPREFERLIVPDAEALAYQRSRYDREQDAQARTDPDSGAPDDRNTRAGYNRFWLNPGTALGRVKGSFRSSWIIDPVDGRIPYSEEGRRLAEAAEARLGYSDPESRPLPDRCMASIQRNGPPMINGLYNNHNEIVQGPDAIVIRSEMMSNARIVRLTDEHGPAAVHPLFGDSIGRWEGDTLVVETRNFHPYHSWQDHPAFLSERGAVTERFTRVADDELLYEFTVDDPTYYSQPWSGEMVWRDEGEKTFEYGCHEGNYAMEGILRGARVLEAQGRPLDQLSQSAD